MHDIHVKKAYSLKDGSFQSGFRNKHFLSLEISSKTFSYCILDIDRYQYRLMESYEFHSPVGMDAFLHIIEEIVSGNEFLVSDFERVTAMYVSPQSVFIPSDFYQEKEKDNYLGFNHLVENGSITCSDKLHILDAYAVYPLPASLKHTLDNLFEKYRLRHFSSALIESVLYDIRYGGCEADMFIHVQNQYFEILILKEGNLVYFNSFEYQTWDDILYYLFYVIEQCNETAENINLLMIGQASMDSSLYKNLKPYFKSVDFGRRSDLFKYDDVFDEIPHHYFYNLLNVNACG